MHSGKKTRSGTWTCSICSYSASSNTALVNHIEKFHDKSLGTPTKSKTGPKSDKLKEVVGYFPSPVKALRLETSGEVKIGFVLLNGLQCNSCQFFATDQPLLEEHQRDEHQTGEAEEVHLKGAPRKKAVPVNRKIPDSTKKKASTVAS